MGEGKNRLKRITSFATSRQSFSLLFVFLLLAAVFTFFYFMHIEGRENYLIQRNFRQLNSISTGIQQRARGLSTAILKNFKRGSEKPNNFKKRLDSLITGAESINVIYKSEKQLYRSVKFDSRDEKLRLEINEIVDTFIVTIYTNIAGIIESKKKSELFEDFFITQNSGNEIFQLPSATVSISKINKLNTEGGDSSNFSALSERDAVASLNWGGEEYTLFIHPMQILGSVQEGKAKFFTICGVIRSDEFKSQCRELSSNIVLLFIVLIVLIVLVWPIVKLKFVSRYGHIKIIDITLASLSIILASAILTFTIMDLFVFNYFNKEVDLQLKNISGQIQKNFIHEIKEVNAELDTATSKLITKIEKGKKNKKHLFKEKTYINLDSLYSINNSDSQSYSNKPKYPFFNLMFWSDENGQQQYKLPISIKRTPFINIKEREYFRHAREDNLWKIDSISSGFFIQPTISLTTGEFQVTLSKNYKNNDSVYVGAVDFLPISIYSPILPRGYSFCIIDEDGLVLFHSNHDRNLNEKFFDECDESSLIKAAVKTHIKGNFTLDYWGKEIRALVRPLGGLPWSLVVMFDIDIIRRSNLESVSVGVFLFALYLLPLIIFLFFFLLIKGLGRNWVWPEVDKQSIYKRLLCCYIFFSLILVSMYLIKFDQTTIFIVTWLFPHSALILSIIIILLKLQKHLSTPEEIILRRYSGTFAAIFILIDFTIILLILLTKKISWAELWFPLTIWIISTVIACFFILLYTELSLRVKRLISRKILGIKLPVSGVKHIFSKNEDGLKEESLQKTSIWYYWAFTALLFLVSILPAIGFFKATYQTQIKLYFKQTQLDYLNRMLTRKQEIYNQYSKREYVNADSLRVKRERNDLDINLSSFFNKPKAADSLNDCKLEPATTWFDNEIVHALIPQFGQAGIMAKTLINDSEDSTHKWQINCNSSLLVLKSNLLKDTIPIFSKLPGLNKAFFPISGTFTSDDLGPLSLRLLLLGIIIIGGIYLFYFLIRFTMESAFLINANDLTFLLKENLLLKTKTGHLLILSSKPELAEEINDKIKAQVDKIKAQVVDIEDVLTKGDQNKNISDSRVIILKNFEYAYTNHEINDKKLILLEDYIHVQNKIVFIISSINPLGDFSYAKSDSDPRDQQSIFNRWIDIFSGFSSIMWYYPDKKRKNSDQLKNEQIISFWGFIKSILFPSYLHTNFINEELESKIVYRFHHELLNAAKELKKFKTEDILLEKTLERSSIFDLSMELTRSYHQFLWSSCSTDEKLVLVRLVQDKFVPVSNIATVEVLFRRGLIKRDPNIKPFNSLFTRFILEANHPEEEFWKEQVSKSGWDIFRIPIFLILIGIIIFLFSTQSEIYQSTLTLVPIVTVLIPALLKLLGLFQSGQPHNKGSD